VEHQGGRAGLAADELLGEQQAVIKPLGRLFQGISGVSGSTILGTGRVALILDVPAICREAILRGSETVLQ
jgi:two-component system chemotaxis sensor kinase CheA